MTAANDLAARRALEAAGVEFIGENGGGLGVRLRKPAKDKVAEICGSAHGRFRIRNTPSAQKYSWSQYGTMVGLFGEDHCA